MKKSEDFYSTIIKNDYSEGSGVCAVINKHISMELNEYGEYKEKNVEGYENDSENRLLSKVSPMSNESLNESEISKQLFGNIDNIKYDQRIGYYQSLYAGHVKESNYREKASSGGIGTWIFKELLEKDLIDGVIHVKENEEPDSSILFKYEISTSIEEVQKGSKTKYYPVEFSEVIKIVKKLPGRYAIIGIPSFIMAIRLLAEHDHIIKDRIKYTIGLICGHQKSSKFADSLAWQVGIKPGNLKSIDFRKKLPNRSASQYGVEMIGYIDNKEVTIVKPMSEFLGYNWGQGFFKSKSSDFTDDVMNETADITIGDAWLPEYTQDNKGNNVIVVRNNKLDEIIKEGIKLGKLNLSNLDKETLFQSQAAHYRHTHDELAYRLYKKEKKGEWHPDKRIKASNDISFLRKQVQDLREEISNQSHIVYKKAVKLDDLDYYINTMTKYDKKYRRLYKIIQLKDNGMKKFFQRLGNKFLRISVSIINSK